MFALYKVTDNQFKQVEIVSDQISRSDLLS